MIQRHYKIELLAAIVFFVAATPAYAASLTQAQIAGVVSLLQADGADTQTIASVSALLGSSATSSPVCSCPILSAGSANTCDCGGTTPPVSPPRCPVILSTNLSLGASGSNVTALQQMLGVSATGYFGAQTKAAVSAWQTAHSLPATGYVGALTRAALATWCSGGSTPPAGTSGSAAPTIYSISPVSGAVGTKIRVTGSGFTSSNTVLLDGDVAASNVPISSTIAIACTPDPSCHPGINQTLTFTIPSSIAPNCPTGSPCPMYVRLVTAGSYNLSVENADGTSSTTALTVTGATSTSEL